MSVSFTKSLRFVRGAFDEGHFVPAFRNFAIRDGMIQGADGIVTICAGIETDMEICVDAGRFARAIVACDEDEDIDLDRTPGGNLRVSAGRFKAFVPIDPSPKEFPWSEPEGEPYGVPEGFLEALKAIHPFIGQDATRPWSNGVLIHKGFLYTTNNVILIQAACVGPEWNEFDNVVLPIRAVNEILRIGIMPKRVLIAETSVTFMYSRTWWLKTQQIMAEWPDIQAVFDKAKGAAPERVSDEFRSAFTRLRTFIQGTAPMFLINGHLSTETNHDAGALIGDIKHKGSCGFQADSMKLVLDAATHIDFGRYPEAFPFVGKTVKGLMAAYKMQAQGPAPTQPVKPEKSEGKPAKKQAHAPAKKK